MKNETKRRKYETFRIARGEGQIAYYRHVEKTRAKVPVKCLWGAEIEDYKAREFYDYAHFYSDAGVDYVRLEQNKQRALF